MQELEDFFNLYVFWGRIEKCEEGDPFPSLD